MSDFAILSLSKKVKSSIVLDAIWKHNARLYDVANADPAKSELNQSLIDNHGISFNDILAKKISEASKVTGHTIKKRANGVLAFAWTATFSHDIASKVNIDTWKQDCLDYMHKVFDTDYPLTDDNGNPVLNEDGTQKFYHFDNIISADLHLDERTPHIHFVVAPIDSRGHMNAASFLEGGKKRMSEILDGYVEAVNKNNPDIQKVRHGSGTSHTKVKKFYHDIEEITSATLPRILPNENIDDYYHRADEEYRKVRAKNYALEQQLKDAEAAARSELEIEYERNYSEQRKLFAKARGVLEKSDIITDKAFPDAVCDIMNEGIDNVKIESMATELDSASYKAYKQFRSDALAAWNDKNRDFDAISTTNLSEAQQNDLR